DKAQQFRVIGQLGLLRYPAEAAHRFGGALLRPWIIAEQQIMLPKPECGVRLESREAAEDALIQETGHSPFESFFHVRTAGVDQLSQMREDRLSKLSRSRDVLIYPWVLPSHSGFFGQFARGQSSLFSAHNPEKKCRTDPALR